VLPEAVCASLEQSRWSRPTIFRWLQRMGNIEEAEMHRTFNCGIGMVLVVAGAKAKGRDRRAGRDAGRGLRGRRDREGRAGAPQTVVV
jgi:phosphoribosylformylglycinamidine cyclo-ligase